MNDRVTVLPEDEKVSISKREYEHLVQCKHDYMALLEKMKSNSICEINNNLQQSITNIIGMK